MPDVQEQGDSVWRSMEVDPTNVRIMAKGVVEPEVWAQYEAAEIARRLERHPEAIRSGRRGRL